MQNTTKLNSEQEKAVKHDKGPLLIVAGAGTGKTTVITEKIAYLINKKDIKPDEILALTFTDKAAGEMEERVDKALPYGYVDLWIMTFHSFCEKILKESALDIGLSNDFKLLNSTEQWMLVRQNLDKFNLDYYQPLGNPTKFIHALTRHFSRCKDEEIWPENYLEYAENLKIDSDSMESTGGEDVEHETKRLNEIANAYHAYQQLLLDNNSLDFGDLINYTLKLFRERPNILKKYQEKFKYILVDEFQDTNWAQYELVKLLASHKNLTVVGDDDQSIYKFRGASVSNIMQFKNDFPKSQEIYLNQNYRSTQEILDLAYNFIQLNNPERLEIKLQKQQNNKTTKQLSKKLISNTEVKGIVEHLHFATEKEEVTAVINKIIEINNIDSETTWNDFAILVRANNSAEPFLNSLRQAGLPFNFLASKGLYSKEIIMDTIAYLKLLDNYHESMALWRVLNYPMVNIKTEDLMQLTNYARRKSISLFETCQQVNILKQIEPETKRKVTKILNFIGQHSKLAKEKSVKTVIYAFLNDYGYKKYLLENNKEKEFIYINQLIHKIDEFEKYFDDKSVKNFMQAFDLELESGEQGSLSKELLEGPEAIKIMTIHASKGLEFKHVFIVNMVQNRFPSMNRKDPIQLPDELIKEILPEGDIHLQEERRLFYVAVTRAKQNLFLTSAEDYGGVRKKKLSRFISEAGFTNNKPTNQQTNKTTELKEEIKFKEKKLEKVNYNLPTSFSFSQLKAFETCPYQYYLNFILKIPTEGKATFSFGKTMHSTLQKFLTQIKQSNNIIQPALFENNKKTKKLPELKELLKIYKESWFDDWYESKSQKEEYYKLGEKSLKDFYVKIEKNTPNVVELEKGFNLKIKDYTIRGVIDRVDIVEDNKVQIIDYKTGSAKTEKTIEKDQLLIYQMAAQDVFGWNTKELTFYYLNNNSEVSFLGTDKEIEKQKEKILDLISNIQKQDFTATPSKFKCDWCDFKGICKFKQT